MNHALSITISNIFDVKIVHNHDLDLWNACRSNAYIYIYIYINHKLILDFQSDGNSNVCHIAHNFQAICCQNVLDLDL